MSIIVDNHIQNDLSVKGPVSFTSKDSHKLSEIHKKDTVNNLVFDSTVFIIQKHDVSLLRKDYFVDQYAKGVGMIYKEASHLSKQNINEEWQSGYYIKYQILDFKN